MAVLGRIGTWFRLYRLAKAESAPLDVRQKATQMRTWTGGLSMQNEPEGNLEPDDVKIKMVPEGTFGGTREKPVEVKDGEPEADDLGDQGGGQN
ncbi:MAG: hypothetical protein JO308_03995 [Verrucomicrobia bacterium]|nr:hypothetical protein [Verrucomicrobiota bacterium]